MKKYFIFFLVLLFTNALFSKALQFDGTDDHVHFYSYDYNISNNLTVEAWVKGPSQSLGAVIGVWITIDDQRSWRLYASNTKVSVGISTDGVNSFSLSSNADAFDNTWHHVAFTFSSGNLRIYVDGALDNQTTHGTITSINSSDTGTLALGYSDAAITFDNAYSGSVDEVRIWNKTLTLSQIQEMRYKVLTSSNGNLASGLNWSDLTGYWRFSEGSGITTSDNSGNSNNGVLVGYESINTKAVADMPNAYTLYCDIRTFNPDVVGKYLRIITGTGAEAKNREIITRVSAYEVQVSSADPFLTTLDETSGFHIFSDHLWTTDSPAPFTDNIEVCGAGRTVRFDGTNDYITTDYTLTSNEFTISLWVRFISFTDGYIVNQYTGTASDPNYARRFLFRVHADGRVNLFMGQYVGNTSIQTNTWYHLAGTRNSSNLVSFYVNGILDASATISGAIPNLPFEIGGTTRIASRNTNSDIDEVSVWNTALTADQIRQIMCKKLTSSNLPSGLSWSDIDAYWRFDEGTGTLADDYSNNGGIATLLNGPTWQWSGAPLGDVSAYDYTGTNPGDFVATLAHPNGDDAQVTGASGTVRGVQVYYANCDPLRENATAPDANWTMSPLRYWGTFITGSSSPTYNLVYNYDGHPGISVNESDLDLAVRDNHADHSWADWNATIDTNANTLSITGQTTREFTLGSQTGDNPLPVILSHFTAVFQNGSSKITWQTQSEENNSHWNIYRSVSQNMGQAIKINPEFIQGAGSTFEPTFYEYSDNMDMNITEFSYWYWLESVDLGGQTGFFGPNQLVINSPDNQTIPQIPEVFGMFPNYPNPFNPSTTIKFRLQEANYGTVAIYNTRGQKIRELFNGEIPKNEIQYVIWDGKDSSGKEVTSGIFIYRLETSDKSFVKKMLLIK
jgi:hypothetical protein